KVADYRFEYDHGQVVEAYDVRLEGLEQSFVVPVHPGNTGDLVVTGTVKTQLVAEPVAGRHEPVKFLDESGDWILSYGAATAIDAAGRQVAMTTTFQDGAFRLELSGEWLASAVFPVVVDPLMATNVTLNGGQANSQVPQFLDVLRDDAGVSENVWICYTRSVSAADQHMWVRRTNDTLPGSLFVTAFTDISASWGNLSCALAYANERVVCAFTRDFGGTRNIRWHAHHINDLGSGVSIGGLT